MVIICWLDFEKVKRLKLYLRFNTYASIFVYFGNKKIYFQKIYFILSFLQLNVFMNNVKMNTCISFCLLIKSFDAFLSILIKGLRKDVIKIN